MRYDFLVIETRTVRVYYAVDAASDEEAREKVEQGETIEEHEVPLSTEVVNRTILHKRGKRTD
jgi:hypothetical protein